MRSGSSCGSYELHVWAWRDNRFGTFVDWNPDVSCAEFNPDGSTH